MCEGDVHGIAAGKIATGRWGEQSFYVEDPFGNKTCFAGRVTLFTGKESASIPHLEAQRSGSTSSSGVQYCSSFQTDCALY